MYSGSFLENLTLIVVQRVFNDTVTYLAVLSVVSLGAMRVHFLSCSLGLNTRRVEDHLN